MASQKTGERFINLMIIIVIVGILAALAVPRFVRAGRRTKQEEAKQVLRQINDVERSWKGLFGRYWGSEIGTWASAKNPHGLKEFASPEIVIPQGSPYQFSIFTSPDSGRSWYYAEARTVSSTGLDDDPGADIWRIDYTAEEPYPVVNDLE